MWLHFRGLCTFWLRLSLPVVVLSLWLFGGRGALGALLLAPVAALLYVVLWHGIGQSGRISTEQVRTVNLVVLAAAHLIGGLFLARLTANRLLPFWAAGLVLLHWQEQWGTKIEERIPGHGGIPALPSFSSPIRAPFVITAPFRAYQGAHAGVDLGVPCGTPIYAPAGGQVVYAGPKGMWGHCLELAHADGWSTFYAHLERTTVRQGEEVAPGQLIAFSGNSGFSTGPHLHLELRYRGLPVRPDGLLAANENAGPR